MIVYRNPVWILFLSIIACSVILYTGVTLYKLYQYQRLNSQAVVDHIDWKAIALGEKGYILSQQEFGVQADYQFTHLGKIFQGQTFWNELYINSFAAEEKKNELQKFRWKVWFNSSNPDHSSIQKIFPLKQVVSTIFLWGFFAYFFWLGQYAQSFFHRKD